MSKPHTSAWSDGAAGRVLASLAVGAFGTDPVSGEELSWQDFAACGTTDPESFFPEKGGSTADAKSVCSGCFVRSDCLGYALDNEEKFGVWGGLSERERRRLRRQAA